MIGMDGFNHIITDLGIFNIFAKLHNISNSKWNITQLILNRKAVLKLLCICTLLCCISWNSNSLKCLCNNILKCKVWNGIA